MANQSCLCALMQVLSVLSESVLLGKDVGIVVQAEDTEDEPVEVNGVKWSKGRMSGGYKISIVIKPGKVEDASPSN